MSDRPTPETDAEVTTFTSVSKLKRRFECSTGKVSAEFARRMERERDEARELARNLYSAGDELRRFTAAYAYNYDEVEGKPGALEAISDFYDASKDIAKILAEEAAK